MTTETMAPDQLHEPVLLREVIRLLVLDPGGIYLDATLGLGGHAEAILATLSAQGSLIGTDMDPEALELASRRLAPSAGRFRLVRANFRNLSQILDAERAAPLSGALFDLGVSSLQLDKPSRGFSIQRDGPLDMRLDPESPLTAERIVNEWPAEQLALLFREFGEEREASRVAAWIVAARAKAPLRGTGELKALIEAKLPRAGRIHPATKVFMALRIAVNRELENLTRGLESVLPRLKPGGRLAVISFHSLEDRIVKNVFKAFEEQGLCRRITHSPMRPSPDELERNPRARSAKLRVVEKRP